MNATKIEIAMSQSLWRLDFAASRSHCLAVIASLLLLSTPATAQISKAWPKHDPELITKLYNGNFAHISDDNFGRMDVEAVMAMFRTDQGRSRQMSLAGTERLGRGIDGRDGTIYSVLEYR